MSKIHKIEAVIPKQIEKKKVAAYARVSALTEMTQYSFSAHINSKESKLEICRSLC